MIRSIEAESIRNKLSNGERLIFVDVSSEKSYDEGHIPRSIHLPLDQVMRLAPRYLAGHEGTDMVVYGDDAVSSETACRQLQTLGFEQLFHYASGKLDWKSKTLPWERSHFQPGARTA